MNYHSINDVRCPICDDEIGTKWFNFRSGDQVEFIAECWNSSKLEKSNGHIFYFQIEVPPCVLIDD